ncbi:MAG: 3-isopropylmalate/(R)-2-methylmalate dehydratase large subunit [Crocinitomix sp.]|jgi:3-isopropylmalate/(R)-2-methylmalate dehydratase large subunit
MKTLFEKIWETHVIKNLDESSAVLYIDHHLIHEVTTPQAFTAIKEKGVDVFRPKQTTATVDHNVPTLNQHLAIENDASRNQVDTLAENCVKQGIEYFGLGHKNQGIVHVIGPELGLTQPGMTLVCGDSHTSTHGAFGTIAFGIGTSQVAQVLAAQSIIVTKPKTMRVMINGRISPHITPKDVILYILKILGSNGGTGYFIEFAGDVIEAMSMEGRMTVCNMSIELGARGGLIAPDQETFDYLKNKERLPKGINYDVLVEEWKKLRTDELADFDQEYLFNGEDIQPMITYGTNPGMGVNVWEEIPEAINETDKNALRYMGFESGKSILGTPINYVFIGSCTNGRIEDFRVVASYVRGKQKAKNVKAYLVPGSQKVLKQIKEEGLIEIFNAANLEIREPGCSACLAMNEDKIPSGEYCVSTSNRNFEGRQGAGSKTLLVGPLMAAAVAMEGKIIEI